MNVSQISERVKHLQAIATGSGDFATVNELFHGTLSVLEAVYGPGGSHVRSLIDQTKDKITVNAQSFRSDLLHLFKAVLTNLQKEIERGFFGSLVQTVTGEVLTDFIGLARTVLYQGGEGAKNVGAVLAASAFEDTIRRMGRTLAGSKGDENLSDIIEALRNKAILQGPQVGAAQSYLNFRNRALHANWDLIELPTVHSALAFTEQLLLKYFS